MTELLEAPRLDEELTGLEEISKADIEIKPFSPLDLEVLRLRGLSVEAHNIPFPEIDPNDIPTVPEFQPPEEPAPKPAS